MYVLRQISPPGKSALADEATAVALINLRRMEQEQGFELIENAPWLNRAEWREIIVSRHSRRIRLVLLDARYPGKGAFTRLIEGITKAGLVPVLVEPSQSLIDWCHRHDYRPRNVGKNCFKQEVWYPRRSAW